MKKNALIIGIVAICTLFLSCNSRQKTQRELLPGSSISYEINDETKEVTLYIPWPNGDQVLKVAEMKPGMHSFWVKCLDGNEEIYTYEGDCIISKFNRLNSYAKQGDFRVWSFESFAGTFYIGHHGVSDAYMLYDKYGRTIRYLVNEEQTWAERLIQTPYMPAYPACQWVEEEDFPNLKNVRRVLK